MALFKCPECGDLISTETIHCPKCGYDVHTYMEENGDKIQCNHCWKLNTPGSTRCIYCGNNLQYSNTVRQGLPKDEMKQEKVEEHERKTLPLITTVVIIVLLLLCLVPKVFVIV